VNAAVPGKPAAGAWTWADQAGRAVARNAGLAIGAGYLILMPLAGFFAPLPYNPVTPNPAAILQPPGSRYWFGTDQNGFDIFSRVIAAGRNDIPLAVAGAAIAFVVGVPIGVLVSRSGRLGNAFMRLLDLFQALPLLVVALTIVALAGSNFTDVVVAISLINVPLFIRQARSEALTVRAHRYVEAVEAQGARDGWVSMRHVLPNILSVVFAQLSLSSGSAVLVIAALGYLGIGVQPSTPSWGLMLNGGAQYIGTGQWWVLVFPAAAIVVTVLAFNAVARGLHKIFDPTVGADG
jgi:peptide/nickel transport system permease protein